MDRDYGYPVESDDLINFFRQHIHMFTDYNTEEVGYLIDIALEDESGLTNLISLIKLNDQKGQTKIKQFLHTLSQSEDQLKLFTRALAHGVRTKQGGHPSPFDLILLNQDIDNAKLYLSIFPDSIDTTINIHKYTVESLAFVINIKAQSGKGILGKFCFEFFHSRSFYELSFRKRMKILAKNLMQCGYILNKEEIITLCGGYTGHNNETWLTYFGLTPTYSLKEEALRECRRNKINLGSLPLALNICTR